MEDKTLGVMGKSSYRGILNKVKGRLIVVLYFPHFAEFTGGFFTTFYFLFSKIIFPHQDMFRKSMMN